MTANELQLNDNKAEAMIILSNSMYIHSPLPSVIHIGDADVPFVSSVNCFFVFCFVLLLLFLIGVTLDSNLSMSHNAVYNTNQAYQFHTTPSHHSSNPDPCLFSCPLSVKLLKLSTFRLPSVLTRRTLKSAAMQEQGLCVNLTHPSYS